MKSFLSFFILFCFIQSNSQELLKGKVLDESNQPIESVYVYWSSNQSGVVSNLDGEFQLLLSPEVDSVAFDHYEYEFKKIAIQDLLKNPVVKLEKFVVVLNESLILNKKGHEVLNDVVSASKVKLDKSLLVNTFSREFISINNEFTQYSDGLLDYYIKRKSGKSDVYVLESRNFNLKQNEEKTGALSVSSPFDIGDAISSAFKFEHIEEILKNSEHYTFQISEFQDSEENLLRRIEISPKENAQELLSEGWVVYDVNSNLILDYFLKAAPETIPYSKLYNFLIAKAKINDFNLRFNFRLENGDYRLVFRRIYFDTYVKSGRKIDDNYQFTSDFVVIGYTENAEPPAGLRKYRMRNLFERGTDYKTEYWKNINAITPTENEQSLIDSLQK